MQTQIPISYSNEKYAMVLASGGLDSTACINFFKNLNFDIDLLFVDYGQLAAEKEYSALLNIAEHYKLALKKIVLTNNKEHKNGLVPGRNAMLYFIALNNYSKPHGLIATGIHADTSYYDCSPLFVDHINQIFKRYTNDSVKISAPFISLKKLDVHHYCIEQKVPIHLTYSCELGLDQPCGICATCKESITLGLSSE